MKIFVNGLPQPSFCFGRILPFCLFMSLLQVTQAKLAPSQLPFPSPLEFEALYLNSQNGDEEEEEIYTQRFRLTSASRLSAEFGGGTYTYNRTGPNTATFSFNTRFEDGNSFEIANVQFIFTFTSAGAGTCTFSGTYSGFDEVDQQEIGNGRYTGTIRNGRGVFSLETSPETLMEWRERYFGDPANSGDGADNFDFDRDGLPNLLEYALGTSPRDAASANLPEPSFVTIAGARYLTLSISRPPGVSGINYIVELSSTLDGSWQSGGGATTVMTNSATHLTVRDNQPIGPALPKRFIRLRVTRS